MGSRMPHRFPRFDFLRILIYALMFTIYLLFVYGFMCVRKFQDDSYAKPNRLCAKNTILAEVSEMLKILKTESL